MICIDSSRLSNVYSGNEGCVPSAIEAVFGVDVYSGTEECQRGCQHQFVRRNGSNTSLFVAMGSRRTVGIRLFIDLARRNDIHLRLR